MYRRPSKVAVLFAVAVAFVSLQCNGIEEGPGDPGDGTGEGTPQLLVQPVPPQIVTKIHELRESCRWRSRGGRPRLTRAVLEKSLALARTFLLKRQRAKTGNFEYEYDFLHRSLSPDDSSARQAGTLWGLACLNLYEPDAEVRAALERGLDFFFQHTRPGPGDSLLVLYPGERDCHTGTVALLSLAVVDYLRAPAGPNEEQRELLRTQLDGYIKFLTLQELADGSYSRGYSVAEQQPIRSTSPYVDGQVLLMLSKVTRHLDYGLEGTIQARAVDTLRHHILTAWKVPHRPGVRTSIPDSDQTKGFFQWGIMSYTEYNEAKWPQAEVYRDATLTLAHWMIRTHRVLERTRNTSYAFEGLIPAYRIALQEGEDRAAEELLHVIDTGMYKLLTWQVGGPLAHENPFLVGHPTRDDLAVGGFLSSEDSSRLRIDTTQHQVHAIIMALEHVYTKPKLVTDAPGPD